MTRRSKAWGIAALSIGTLVALLLSIPLRTNSQIKGYRESIRPGMTLDELTNMMGVADRVIGSDRQLDRAHHYEIPPIGSNTVIYFYPHEGLPYYNLFVFVDMARGEVVELVVDKM